MKRPVVIGLEVHLQLKTKTKLFCSCSTDYIGVAPNSNVCPVCLAVPGTLPTLNDKAVEFAARLGLGLHCEIMDGSDFFRKGYFYADLPKAYQITQEVLDEILPEAYSVIKETAKRFKDNEVVEVIKKYIIEE